MFQIFFKLVADFNNIYGGDAYAMKGAGMELAGLSALLFVDVDGLHCPLMALIG